MKIKTLLMLFVFGLSLSTNLNAEEKSISGQISERCNTPVKPSIPNGRSSSEEEMIAAQQEMKAFIAAGNEYLECLDKVEAGWGEEASKEDRSFIVLLHNKAVDEMTEIADLFNAALRAYKGKS